MPAGERKGSAPRLPAGERKGSAPRLPAGERRGSAQRRVGGRAQGLGAEAAGERAHGRAAKAAGGRAQRLAGAVLHGGGLLLAAPLWLWWALDHGGYLSPAWITGLVVLALATSVALLLVPGARAPQRWAAVAAGALFAYAAISALSMLVASDRGQAWLWSERALLYALAFALPVLWPPSLRAVKAGLVLWIAAALAALAVGLLRARHGVLVDGRLSEPTTYPNATAALLLMAAVPGVMLAALPRSTIAQRALGLAAAGALASGAVLTQSRGILIVGALAGVGAVLLTPARLRLAAAGACVLAALAWQRHALLDLHQLAAGGDPAGGAERAIVAIGAIAAALAVVGAAWALAERRVTVPAPTPAQRRRMRRAGSLAAVAAAVAVALLVTDGRPAAWAGAHLRDFKTPDYQRVETSDSRFTGGLGSNRYDYWRVAVGATLREPLRGSGAGSFVQTYFAQRRTLRAPVYAHQLWLGTAAELGLPGLAALLAFVAAFARRPAAQAARPCERRRRAAARCGRPARRPAHALERRLELRLPRPGGPRAGPRGRGDRGAGRVGAAGSARRPPSARRRDRGAGRAGTTAAGRLARAGGGGRGRVGAGRDRGAAGGRRAARAARRGPRDLRPGGSARRSAPRPALGAPVGPSAAGPRAARASPARRDRRAARLRRGARA